MLMRSGKSLGTETSVCGHPGREAVGNGNTTTYAPQFSRDFGQARIGQLLYHSARTMRRTTQAELLKALQVRAARIALGPFTTRGRGSAGAVKAGREFLNFLPVAQFGTSNLQKFRSALEAGTLGLKDAFPRGSRYWGLARKGLNIFLRDCLYTVYLRDAHSLNLAERFFEVPLDSLTGEALFKVAAGRLPRWHTVRGLTRELSDEYQAIASEYADSKGIARVHLDVFWWGTRLDGKL